MSSLRGSLVWLRLHPYPQRSLAGHKHHKLAPKFYGPFSVVRKIGQVAYQLALPPDCKLHDVFHVSLLKPWEKFLPVSLHYPPLEDGKVVFVPDTILPSRLNRGNWEILVQWCGFSADDATWGDLVQFRDAFPHYKLEDKLFLQEERCYGCLYCVEPFNSNINYAILFLLAFISSYGIMLGF